MTKSKHPATKNWEALDSETNHEAVAGTSQEVQEESPPKELTHLSYKALEAQLVQTEAVLEEHKSQLIQLREQEVYRRAEMENIRRRCKLDVENAHKFSLEGLIKELLPVRDGLEAAITGSNRETRNDTVLEGVNLTLQTLHRVLERSGVSTIDPPLGDPFDAHYHQAMLTEHSEKQASNTILRVLQKGYLLNGRLVRPAMVVVAKAVEEDT